MSGVEVLMDLAAAPTMMENIRTLCPSHVLCAASDSGLCCLNCWGGETSFAD